MQGVLCECWLKGEMKREMKDYVSDEAILALGGHVDTSGLPQLHSSPHL